MPGTPSNPWWAPSSVSIQPRAKHLSQDPQQQNLSFLAGFQRGLPMATAYPGSAQSVESLGLEGSR